MKNINKYIQRKKMTKYFFSCLYFYDFLLLKGFLRYIMIVLQVSTMLVYFVYC